MPLDDDNDNDDDNDDDDSAFSSDGATSACDEMSTQFRRVVCQLET